MNFNQCNLIQSLWNIQWIVHISERMAELMEDDKVTIKEEISTVEDMCTVYVVGEDVKEESTEKQGMVEHFLYNYIY